MTPSVASFRVLGHLGFHEATPSPHGSCDGLFHAFPTSDPKTRLTNRGWVKMRILAALLILRRHTPVRGMSLTELTLP